MKYSDLISFHPIEDVIQLVTAENKDKAREYVKTYVMSDSMAESLQAPVLDQLQMDEVVDNKGVLIVGNYGTGKSHLMSVISAIATDAGNVQYLQNKKFAEQVKPIAGKFEVLRIEIGGVVMPLYDVIMGYVQDDFEKRGIDFEVPDYKSVKSIKTVLKDKVRNIEGFPIGTDEDIIALSDAPYYTACPNPFIEEYIKENGTPYDEATDDYHREPFAADVSEGKSDDIYNYHTYHTKVPPKAILKYILHYTEPDDVIYDAFCGSGMTGVAAAMSSRNEYTNYASKTGRRFCVLSDISAAASFIAQGYNYPKECAEIENIAEHCLEWLRKDFGWAYETNHIENNSQALIPLKGEINYTVWSDIVLCPQCGKELCFYKVGIDSQTGHKKGNAMNCPHCGYVGKTSEFERAKTIPWRQPFFDEQLWGRTVCLC